MLTNDSNIKNNLKFYTKKILSCFLILCVSFNFFFVIENNNLLEYSSFGKLNQFWSESRIVNTEYKVICSEENGFCDLVSFSKNLSETSFIDITSYNLISFYGDYIFCICYDFAVSVDNCRAYHFKVGTAGKKRLIWKVSIQFYRGGT